MTYLESSPRCSDFRQGVCPKGGSLGLGLEVATETRPQRGERLHRSQRAIEGGHLGIPGAVADQVPSFCLGRLWGLIQLLLWHFLGILPGGHDEDLEDDEYEYELYEHLFDNKALETRERLSFSKCWLPGLHLLEHTSLHLGFRRPAQGWACSIRRVILADCL